MVFGSDNHSKGGCSPCTDSLARLVVLAGGTVSRETTHSTDKLKVCVYLCLLVCRSVFLSVSHILERERGREGGRERGREGGRKGERDYVKYDYHTCNNYVLTELSDSAGV